MGFVSFFGLATMLYFIYPDPAEDQFVAISIFLLVWIAYGAVYYLKPDGVLGRESLYNISSFISEEIPTVKSSLKTTLNLNIPPS